MSVDAAIRYRQEQEFIKIISPFRAAVDHMVQERASARRVGAWIDADDIRDTLTGFGFDLEDDQDGTWVRIPGTSIIWFVRTEKEKTNE